VTKRSVPSAACCSGAALLALVVGAHCNLADSREFVVRAERAAASRGSLAGGGVTISVLYVAATKLVKRPFFKSAERVRA
jgi:hypothetical protein